MRRRVKHLSKALLKTPNEKDFHQHRAMTFVFMMEGFSIMHGAV